MELEKMVCSLGPAMRLKELGVKQESAYAWWKQRRRWKIWYCGNKFPGHAAYSAFTVAELGEMLPPHHISRNRRDGKWTAWCNEGTMRVRFFVEHTEADARAKMLIYLLENNLIKREAK